MQQALADAGATVEDVDYVNAHGTSTPMNDRSEAAAMRAVFGAEVERVAVSSTKSVMGHLIAAAGAVEAAVCALAIQRGEMPVNANLRELDPECGLNIVRDEPRRAQGAGRAVQLLRLRRLQQQPRLPSSRGGGRHGRRSLTACCASDD